MASGVRWAIHGYLLFFATIRTRFVVRRSERDSGSASRGRKKQSPKLQTGFSSVPALLARRKTKKSCADGPLEAAQRRIAVIVLKWAADD